jgi:hypothetical protein
MFNLFRRPHPTSEQIAKAIAPLVNDAQARGIADRLDLTAAEEKRFLFGVFTLTLSMPQVWALLHQAVLGKNFNLGSVIYASSLVTGQMYSKSAQCLIADYTLYAEEFSELVGVLVKHPHVAIRYDSFEDTSLQFIDLASALFAVRSMPVIRVFLGACAVSKSDVACDREKLVIGWSDLLSEWASLTKSIDRSIILSVISPLVAARYAGVTEQMNNVFGIK